MATKINDLIEENLYSIWPQIMHYIKENEECIKQLPKLYFLANGRNGWNSSFSRCSKSRSVDITNKDCSGEFIDCDNLEVFAQYSSKRNYSLNKRDIIRIMKNVTIYGIYDFNSSKEYLEKEYSSLNQGTCPRPVEQFFIESVVYNLNISYKEFKNYYKGRKESCFHITQEQYLKKIEETKIEAAKRALLKEKKHFKNDYWDEVFS